MQLAKYSIYKDKVYTTVASGEGSTTSSSPSSSSADRNLWGNNDTGNDMEGSMRIQGNIYIMGDMYEEDENGDLVPTTRGGEASSRAGDDTFPPSEEDGEGNLFLDGKVYSDSVETRNDITAGKHLYIKDPHPDHNGEKKCVGEMLMTLEDKIKAETERAKGAEKDLNDAIEAEQKRAENIEDNLDKSIQLCEQSIKNNADEIVDLKNRTTANETAIANFMPVGSIIMFNGLAKDIPEGWHICDGTNGTPNLKDKFIKASDTAGQTGGSNSVTLVAGNIPKTSLTVNNAKIGTDKEWKLRLNKYVPTLDEVGEYVFDKGGTSHYCLYTGYDEGDKGLLGVTYSSIIQDVADYAFVGTDGPSAIDTQPEYYSLIFIMKVS